MFYNKKGPSLEDTESLQTGVEEEKSTVSSNNMAPVHIPIEVAVLHRMKTPELVHELKVRGEKVIGNRPELLNCLIISFAQNKYYMREQA